MRHCRHAHRIHSGHRGGFGLVDSTIAVMLVGILMVTSLQTIGASKRREGNTLDRLLGQQLAGALMSEILLQVFKEPDSNQASVFGPEAGESTGNRSLFDDVDDYNNWSTTPPTDRNGTVLSGFANWTRSVTVAWADPNTLASTAATNTGLKKITINVSKGGKLISSLIGYRSIGWTDTIPAPTDATGNHAPIAVATANKLSDRVGRTFTFTGTSSSDQDGDYLSYVWNFGDGMTAVGTAVNKSYSVAGNYTCTLTVYDGRGGIGTAALSMVILP